MSDTLFFVAFRFCHKLVHYNPFNCEQSARVISKTSHKVKGNRQNPLDVPSIAQLDLNHAELLWLMFFLSCMLLAFYRSIVLYAYLIRLNLHRPIKLGTTEYGEILSWPLCSHKQKIAFISKNGNYIT